MNRENTFELERDLCERLEARGVRISDVTWNDDWLERVNSMPEGQEKEDEKNIGVNNILQAVENMLREGYTVS